jgi:hypothetical protein
VNHAGTQRLAGMFETRPLGPQDSTMQGKLLLAMSGALCLLALSVIAAAGGAGGWMVAMPPFKPIGGAIVVDSSAPMNEWVRQGAFASEAACKAELMDQASRVEAAQRFAAGHSDPRLTEALKLQVVEAVRQARCVPVGN